MEHEKRRKTPIFSAKYPTRYARNTIHATETLSSFLSSATPPPRRPAAPTTLLSLSIKLVWLSIQQITGFGGVGVRGFSPVLLHALESLDTYLQLYLQLYT